MPREKREVIRLEVRLPPELHEILSESAAQHERSLNAEIVVRLRESVTPAKKARR